MGCVDIALLSLLHAASQQDDDGVAASAEINPAARAEINPDIPERLLQRFLHWRDCPALSEPARE